MIALNDVYHINERVGELYPGLSVEGIPGAYRVRSTRPALVRCGPHFAYTTDQPYTVMSWPEQVLDARLLRHLRFSDSWSGQRDILRELEEADYRREQAQERAQADLSEQMAKDIAKRLRDNPI